MQITADDTALVLTDPQNDFLSPEGVTWEWSQERAGKRLALTSLEQQIGGGGRRPHGSALHGQRRDRPRGSGRQLCLIAPAPVRAASQLAVTTSTPAAVRAFQKDAQARLGTLGARGRCPPTAAPTQA